jgi:hypothetical protein
VDRKDRTWFLDFLKQTVQTRFSVEFDRLFKHLLDLDGEGGNKDGGKTVTVEHMRSVFFGDYMDSIAGESGPRDGSSPIDMK